MPQDQQQLMATLISFGILAVVLAFRARRMSQPSRLKVERLWMFPVFFTAIVAALFYAHPPHGLFWLYCALALALGVAAGWYRGMLMHIHVDPETHVVSQQGGRAAMVFILVLILFRFGARNLAMNTAGNGPEAAVNVTDVLLAFALGFVVAQRLEMGLRARALLRQARGERA